MTAGRAGQAGQAGVAVVAGDTGEPGAPEAPGAVRGAPRTAYAVVPLRDLTSGKTRLAAALEPTERAALVTATARHVVGVLQQVPDVARVVVVTTRPREVWRALGDLADRLVVTLQPADAPGLDAAADAGRRTVVALAAEAGEGAPGARPRVLVVHADLPALTPADVAAVLAHDEAVVVATDRFGTGTNVLALDASDADFRTAYGPGSAARHQEEAARLGRACAVVHRAGTETDLDTPADWAVLPEPVRAALARAVPGLADALA